MHDLVVAGGEVLLADGSFRRVDIGVTGGRIAGIGEGLAGAEHLDATGLTVLPGLVDEHFHVFWGYGWETYEGATRAAAKGGITTVIDMPLDRPATLTAEALERKVAAVAGDCHVDWAAFGGYLAENPAEIAAMAEAGAVACKLFTGGVAPPGMYPGVDAGQMLDAMRRCREAGLTVVVHSEESSIVDFETARLQAAGRTDVAAWDEARPWFAEVAAVQQVALLAQVTGARVVIAHVTSHQAVEAVRLARLQGADVWVETCPHYLCVTLEEMAGNTLLKWNPPSREAASVERLWAAFAAGEVHTIGSDHAPTGKTPGADIWSQFPGAGNGLEGMLPLVATEAARRGISLAVVAKALSETPARLFGLYPRKGVIAVGADADLCIVETNGSRTIDAQDLEYHEQEKWSPFDGRVVTTYPVYTVLRGRTIFAEGEVVGAPADGLFLPGFRAPGDLQRNAGT
jgi:allantoinase